MTEETKDINRSDNDFKYVMMDTGNLYLGARFSFDDLLKQEMVPFKFKAIISHYLLKEADKDTTLESQFYYLEEGSFLYDTFLQLKVKIKVSIMQEKKNLFGKSRWGYAEKIFTLKELVEMNLAKKKACGVMIQEIIISKLAMMSFSV